MDNDHVSICGMGPAQQVSGRYEGQTICCLAEALATQLKHRWKPLMERHRVPKPLLMRLQCQSSDGIEHISMQVEWQRPSIFATESCGAGSVVCSMGTMSLSLCIFESKHDGSRMMDYMQVPFPSAMPPMQPTCQHRWTGDPGR